MNTKYRFFYHSFFIIALIVLAGCDNAGKKSVGNTVNGHYVRTDPRQGELDLNEAGEFIIGATTGYGNIARMTGTYQIGDKSILFKFPNGEAFKGILNQTGSTISVSHQEASEFEGIWNKQ